MDNDQQTRLRRNLEANKQSARAAKASDALDADLERIAAITKVARGNWFSLIAGLAFAGTTILSVKHIDFYDLSRQTKLPILAIEVPISLFFFFSPIILLLLFGYFHIYLLKLWAALMRADPEPNGTTLGEQIPPWLVSDFALFLRFRNRKGTEKNAMRKRSLDTASMFLVFVFTWLLGIIVIGAFWYNALGANRYDLAVVAGACLSVAISVGWISLLELWTRSRRDDSRPGPWRRETVPILLVTTVVFSTFADIRGFFETVGLNLAGEEIIKKPENWISYQQAKQNVLNEIVLEDIDVQVNELAQELLRSNRASAYASLSTPRLPQGVVLTNANLHQVFWPNADLSRAQMKRADLSRALMEGANLSETQMQGANLSRAQMEGADLSGALMEGANLRFAKMEAADFSVARMNRANFEGANIELANFHGAQMEQVNLSDAQMQGANFLGAQMAGANFFGARMQGTAFDAAQMEGTEFREAQMQRASLDYSRLIGSITQTITTSNTNLKASTNNGGALRFVDFTEAEFDKTTDFRNAFMDGTVKLPPAFRSILGDQCQSVLGRELEDENFYGRWRGWVQHESNPSPNYAWRTLAPPGFEDITPIPPDPGCEWKTGPMPGTE